MQLSPTSTSLSRRRRWVAGLAALAAAGALAGGLAGASGGSGPRVATAPVSVLRTRLIAQLRAQHLSYHAVACVRTGRSFHGVGVVRCNVDFGDPHIQAYCLVLRGGRLDTSEEDAAIPCGHDDAGFSTQLETGP
jgi:hypothetical protein